MIRLLFCMSLISCCFSSSVSANSDDTLSEGGRLYDKWWQEYNLVPPNTTHPSYPPTSQKIGGSSWRCKECHGWDYRGRNGAYAKGSHFTDITGIDGFAGKDENEVVDILKNTTHQYDRVILDRAIQLIAKFVVNGQVDMDKYIDRQTRKAKGDVVWGQDIFEKKCARCHGDEGRDINFGNENNPEYLSTVAVKNPWEALHKIINGHPGARMNHKIIHSSRAIHQRYMSGGFRSMERMPSMRGVLSDEQIADLLTYLQTLPVN